MSYFCIISLISFLAFKIFYLYSQKMDRNSRLDKKLAIFSGFFAIISYFKVLKCME